MRVHVPVPVPMCEHVEDRDRHWLSSSIALHCMFETFSNLTYSSEIAQMDWPASSCDPPASASQRWDCRHMPPPLTFYGDAEDMNLGLHLCIASTLSTEPFPQAHIQ